jgi:tripartite-type tricarboxylate transporter receptor subunit TctC
MPVVAIARCLAAAGCAAWLVSTAAAQEVEPFYRGKTIELYVGYTPGGAYDLYARLIARHLGRFIPGAPTIVPKNMDGAGSLRLANYLANVAPKDGTVLGTIGRATALDPIFGQKGAQFRGSDFAWIGSPTDETSVCTAMATSGIARFEELQTRELIVGSISLSDDTGQFPRLLNGWFGAKLKSVTGYPGGNNIVLAMERGEVQGRCGWSWSSVKSTRPEWLEQKKINILLQMALAKHPELAGVPLVIDLAKDDEHRRIMKLVFARQSIGWPYVAPPGLPRERVEILRRAFADTFKDGEFLAEAAKAKLAIRPVSGQSLEALVADVYATPAAIAQKAADLLN